MTEQEFARLAAQGYNRIPVVAQTMADLETPLTAYLKLANRPNTYLLESVVGGERFGRYSFIGLACQTLLRAYRNTVSVVHAGAVVERIENTDPLAFVRAYLQRFRVPDLPGLPRFVGGLCGYLGYDTVRWIEPRLAGGWDKPDVTGCPDMLLLLAFSAVMSRGIDTVIIAGTLTNVCCEASARDAMMADFKKIGRAHV